jgi:hypothetical protein
LGLSEKTSQFRGKVWTLEIDGCDLGIGATEVADKLLQRSDAELMENIWLREVPECGIGAHRFLFCYVNTMFAPGAYDGQRDKNGAILEDFDKVIHRV